VTRTTLDGRDRQTDDRNDATDDLCTEMPFRMDALDDLCSSVGIGAGKQGQAACSCYFVPLKGLMSHRGLLAASPVVKQDMEQGEERFFPGVSNVRKLREEEGSGG